MTPEITLEPERPDDDRLLFELYSTTRAAEMALMPWTGEQRRAFLRQQYELRHFHYLRYLPGAEYLLIRRAGAPIGRIAIHLTENEIRIVDIALLPEHRGVGIGSRLIHELLLEAGSENMPVTLHVERHNRAAGLGLLSFISRPALGATISTTIGSQHFTDAQIVGSAVFAAALTGQPAPFDAIIGSDITGPNFSGAWTFHYTLAAGESITGASVLIGVWDGDSLAGGNQVGSFTLNTTVDLTAPLNTAFEGHGGATGEYDVYSATIPASAFASLAGGSATFNLALTAPGLGVLGTTDFNGAGMDFRHYSLSHPLPSQLRNPPRGACWPRASCWPQWDAEGSVVATRSLGQLTVI